MISTRSQDLRTPAMLGERMSIAVPEGFSFLDVPWYRLWVPAIGQQWQDVARTIPAVADSDPVGSALSLFGSAKYATQATAGKRLLLRTGANGIGGRACWEVDATDDFLREAFGETLSQPLTIYIVCSFGSTAAIRIAYARDTGTAFAFYAANGTGNLIVESATAVNSGDPNSGVQMYSVLHNTTASTLRQNGVAIMGASDTGTNTLTGITIGATASDTLTLGGKISFIGIRQGADSVAQQQQIEQSIKNFFSLVY